MSFQKTVMIVSVILLICALIMIGVALYKQKNSDDVIFPPVVSDCPDYWVNESKDNNIVCVNEKKLGDCDKDMDFSLQPWVGTSGLCNKFKWARKCGITWDGVTNNPKACN